jgi:hypothetical protein
VFVATLDPGPVAPFPPNSRPAVTNPRISVRKATNKRIYCDGTVVDSDTGTRYTVPVTTLRSSSTDRPGRSQAAGGRGRGQTGERSQEACHGTTLYNSIHRYDNDMIVNTHIYGTTAPYAPALHLRRPTTGDLFGTTWRASTLFGRMPRRLGGSGGDMTRIGSGKPFPRPRHSMKST